MLRKLTLLACLTAAPLAVAETPAYAGGFATAVADKTTATVMFPGVVDVCVALPWRPAEDGYANVRMSDGSVRMQVGYTYPGRCSGWVTVAGPAVVTAVQACNTYAIPYDRIVLTCSAWVPLSP